jgi:hypothetical protein
MHINATFLHHVHVVHLEADASRVMPGSFSIVASTRHSYLLMCFFFFTSARQHVQAASLFAPLWCIDLSGVWSCMLADATDASVNSMHSVW